MSQVWVNTVNRLKMGKVEAKQGKVWAQIDQAQTQLRLKWVKIGFEQAILELKEATPVVLRYR